jgi:hypothetical protein
MYRTNADEAPDVLRSRPIEQDAKPVPVCTARPARLRLITFLIILVGTLSAISVLNFVVNPLGYYPVSIFHPLTWSTRQIKAALMISSPPVEALILGSSRTMSLSPAEIHRLSGLRAFNASVDSARIEDDLAIFRFATEERGWNLREVVVGLDVEAFHDGIPPDPRLSTAPEFRHWLPWTPRLRVITGALKDLVSLGQAHQSLRSIELHIAGLSPRENVFQRDGWNDAEAWDEKFARGLVRSDIDVSLGEYSNRYAGFQHVDVDRARMFEDLLASASRRGMKVRAFLTPLHPKVLERLRRERDFERLRNEVVSTLRDLESKNAGFSFRDYTEVQSFGGSVDLFMDGAHVRKGNADRILAALYRD